MFSKELIWILMTGVVAMIGIIACQMKWYGVAMWKSVVVAVALTLTGLYGSELWYFVENGSFGGRSFYGSIFFAPIVFAAVAFLLRMRYLHSLAFCAPAGCLMLALIKVDCLMTGCCKGRPIGTAADGTVVRFPSQIAEMIGFLVLCVVLLCLSRKEKYRQKIFPLFLVMYGTERFVLNLFRDEMVRTKHWLPIGNLWSVIAIVIGILWLMLLRNKELDEQLVRLQEERKNSQSGAIGENQ